MVQSWSPMIPESYPGLFWDPATGKMSSQHEIMSRLKWPMMGDIPYQYNPPRPRGFLGMEYPLVQTNSGAQWGYSAGEEQFLAKGPMTAAQMTDYLKKLPFAQTNISTGCKSVVDYVANDKSLSKDAKIQVLQTVKNTIVTLMGMFKGAKVDPAVNVCISLMDNKIQSLKGGVPVSYIIGGVAVAGIAGVVGYMMYRRKK